MNSALDPGRFAPDSSDDGGDPTVDTGTIDWLLPEIVNAFDAAMSALREFRAGAAGVGRKDVDLAPLRGARSHLHQAHGALELGEIGGVTRLTEAMEELLATFESDPARCDAISLDAITAGCRAIVEYLEDLQGGARQQPLHLFPAYRELLAARGVDRIHPADLFLVDLGVRAPRAEPGTVLDVDGLKEQRGAFEQGLLRYLRNDRDTEALAALYRAVAAVEESVASSAKQGQVQQRGFWWATRGLFDALANDGFEHARAQHAHIKRLAGRINLQIRKLVDGSGAVAERLYTDVLFFVAVAAPVTPLVREVQTRYRLGDSVPNDYETQRYGRVDPAMLRAARDAIASAKMAWSAIVSGDVGQIRTFAKETGAVMDAVGPIRRPGLAQVAQVIDSIATDLGFDPRQPSASVGLDVATALLFLEGALERARSLDTAFDARAATVAARVEASVLGREHAPGAEDWLDRMSRKAEERLTVTTFVAELQANLRNAEKVLDAFFREPTQRAALKDAQRSLAQVSGALALLGHDEVHRAIDQARRTIDGFENGSQALEQGAFQELARSLGAVGFYVEQIKRERIDSNAFRFDAASGSFSADMARPPALEPAAAEQRTVEQSATQPGSRQAGSTHADSTPPNSAVANVGEPSGHEPVDADGADAPPPTLLDDFDVSDAAFASVEAPSQTFAATPSPATPQYDPFAATDIAFAATEILDNDATLEDEIGARASDAVAHMALLRQQPDDDAARAQLIAALDDVRRNAMLIDDRPLFDEAADVLSSLRASVAGPLGFAAADDLAVRVAELVAHANRSVGIAAPSAAPLVPVMPVPDEDNVEAVDAELLEIFLEEAGDVLVDAKASMRLLDADPANGTATLTLRRNFHTLKGSGRMVGLMAFGSAAWSIEEVLNDHLAGQRPASADLRALLDYAIRYLSDWTDDLRTTGVSSRVPDALIEAARTVRDGAVATSPPSIRVSLPSAPATRDLAPSATAGGSNAVTLHADANADRHEATPHEDDFLKTEYAPSRTTSVPPDPYFAATQILGDGAEVPDLEFFGAQPAHRQDEPPEKDQAGDHDRSYEEPGFGLLFAPDDEPSTPEATPAPAGSDADEAVLDHMLEKPATATEIPHDEPAMRPSVGGDDFALDFDEPSTSAGDAAAPVDEPVEAVDAEAAVPSDADVADAFAAFAAFDASMEPVPPAVSNVVPFTMPRGPVRAEDVRQIGSLTLSVALFNIYLTEADELLRVLTQDFAEWRHELDRYVSEGAMRAAHSLAGSSATVGLVAAHDLAAAVEEVLQQLWREPVEIREDQVAVLQDAVESLRKMLHRFAAERMPEPDPARVAGLIALRRDIAGHDATRDDARTAASPFVDQTLSFVALDFGDPLPTATVLETGDPTDAAETKDAIDGAAADHGDDGVDAAARLDDHFLDAEGDASMDMAPVDEAATPFDLDETMAVDESIDLPPLPEESVFEHDPFADLASARSELPLDDEDGFDAITTIGVSETPFDADSVVDRWMTPDHEPAFDQPFEKMEPTVVHAVPVDAELQGASVVDEQDALFAIPPTAAADAALRDDVEPVEPEVAMSDAEAVDLAAVETDSSTVVDPLDDGASPPSVEAFAEPAADAASFVRTTDEAPSAREDSTIVAAFLAEADGDPRREPATPEAGLEPTDARIQPEPAGASAVADGVASEDEWDIDAGLNAEPLVEPIAADIAPADVDWLDAFGVDGSPSRTDVLDAAQSQVRTFDGDPDIAELVAFVTSDDAMAAVDPAESEAQAVPSSRGADAADATNEMATSDGGSDAGAFDEGPSSEARSEDADLQTDPHADAMAVPTRATIAAEAEAVAAARRGAPVAPEAVQDDIDPELLDVFVAEGGEILPQIGTLLRTWQARPGDAAPARLLLRHLHTLKGSARMAGAMRLGEVAHDVEARVESAARLHDVPSALFDELLAAHDRSLELFDRLQNPAAPEATATSTADAAPGVVGATAVAAASGAADAVATPATGATPRARDQKQASQQAVRVNSDTLDRLVNLAGEVSISRARIENEILQIKGAMSDLGENVERLRSQLREIELQAEFQMQSQMQSQQAAGREREKFDPLEFDRFTRFQELTRMMAESVNDVKTLQQHLQKSLDTAETDLTSQRRMTRDLQQDLMRVRMVPFGSIAERLYRVARRTAKEVDKRVNLDIRGGSVEIDRGVLERMAGPFEHLLRNHIVHGIETREARRASGKDETGELLVEVRQEGNEIVLTFSDDGAGLDLDRIRRKGRELGLIDDREIPDAAVAEMIFHPGFSTASEVTELAGRGVGMDVVRAEAVVLAGRVSVDSEAGKGTRFTINLPLTLAITQVVLVSVANRVYALPAVLVEQVQQLRPQPLADAYRAGRLEWAGAPVRVAFLGTLLGIDDAVPVAQRTSPVLILRSAGERIAIHVDEVVGNQEVVVKNLGPQLARMTGIAGATVLGSGEIVLILNPVQLAQMVRTPPLAAPVVDDRTAATAATEVPASGDAIVAPTGGDLKTLPTVMVVDDSLTVRRVTQRLLSREGYQVVLAKDGVDALEQLQDFAPDVMLVDIEMPRMDGFDLTRNVRNDERYRHIPIIMITSRTAEKHRQHAAELGVDAYLGKPYQEDELLDLLTMHVGSRRSHPA